MGAGGHVTIWALAGKCQRSKSKRRGKKTPLDLSGLIRLHTAIFHIAQGLQNSDGRATVKNPDLTKGWYVDFAITKSYFIVWRVLSDEVPTHSRRDSNGDPACKGWLSPVPDFVTSLQFPPWKWINSEVLSILIKHFLSAVAPRL